MNYTASVWDRPAIPTNWESADMNNQDYYLASPVAKFVRTRGDFSEDRHMSRTFNRRLRMRDTFTSIIPLYKHEPKTCYTATYTHSVFPEYKEDITGKPLGKVSRQYNHKFDPIKVYNEEMLKLRDFAPKPIKSAKASGV